MNDENFERHLREQPLRKIPGDWREDILRTARAKVPATDQHRPGVFIRAGLKLWRELVWPCRHAWSGLAALWIVLWALNTRLADVPRGTMADYSGTSSGMVQSFEEQRRVLAELTGPIEPLPIEPPYRTKLHPRSERVLIVRAC